MPDFKLSPKAREDLEAIWDYSYDTWGEKQANNYVRQLNDGFELLADAPDTGQDVSHIREGYRKHQVGRHVIFYRSTPEDDIEVVRVLHERMDTDRHL
jgi:toxin ParE1/3/4